MLHTCFCRALQVDREVAPTEIKSKASEHERAGLRTRYGIKEISNPLLSIRADLFRSGILYLRSVVNFFVVCTCVFAYGLSSTCN